MRVFVTGGSGFVGRHVVKNLTEVGHEVTVLSRKPLSGDKIAPRAHLLIGNPNRPGEWQQKLAEHDAVVNLAGSPINHRWTKEVRRKIMYSRVNTTRHVVEAIQSVDKPMLLLNASAVGYYGMREDGDDAVLDESASAGKDFLAEVAQCWEDEAMKAGREGVRVCVCRFGVVLGRGGGALEAMMPAFKWFLGSRLGSGRQWISWVHIDDLTAIFRFLIEADLLSGPFNCTAPNPVRNEDFTRILKWALDRPSPAPPIPGCAIRVALGDMANMLLKGQRVTPKRLLEEGFLFRYASLEATLVDLVSRSGRGAPVH